MYNLNSIQGQKHQDRSGSYTHIKTADLYQIVENFGFDLVKQSVSKPKNQDLETYSRHIATFQSRRPLQINTPNQLEPEICYTRIIIDNSHDGTRALYIRFGLYRQVCSNGLVIGSDIVQPLRYSHVNVSIEEIEQDLSDFIKISTIVAEDLIKNLMSVRFDSTQKLRFIEEAFKLRYKTDDSYIKSSTRMSILHVRRPEDSFDSVWSVYNLVQENLIEGVRKRSKRMTSDRSLVDFNNALSNLVVEILSAA